MEQAQWRRFREHQSPDRWRPARQELPVGQHPMQLYSLATPNGEKVTILLEELLARGHAGAEYDAWLIHINDGDQFGSGFVAVNPNSKIPALLDRSGPTPMRVFESGAILLIWPRSSAPSCPRDPTARAESLSWLFWQMGSAPFLGGGFGHFYVYAPVKIEYADRPLRDGSQAPARRARPPPRRPPRILAGDEYTIADIAIWPWYGALSLGTVYGAPPVPAGAAIHARAPLGGRRSPQRPAVQRGRRVNRTSGDPATSCASGTMRATSSPGPRTNC